jgi:hypothetical protein
LRWVDPLGFDSFDPIGDIPSASMITETHTTPS